MDTIEKRFRDAEFLLGGEVSEIGVEAILEHLEAMASLGSERARSLLRRLKRTFEPEDTEEEEMQESLDPEESEDPSGASRRYWAERALQKRVLPQLALRLF